MHPSLKTFSALLFGSIAAVSSASAADKIITWSASYTGEAAEVLDGGLARRGAMAGQVFLGADTDLGKLLGWNGATLHLGLNNRHGENLSDNGIGNSTSVQEIYGGQNTRLVRVTLEQNLFDGRFNIEVGRTPANISFLGSSYCQYFQMNAACGNPTFVFKNSNFTWWPTSSWAAHATAWLTPEIYLHGGIYEVNPNRALDSDHDLDWSTNGTTGYIAPFALGHKTTFANSRLPHKWEIGAWYDESDYTDPLRAANGQPALTAGLPYATRTSGRSGFYARFEQMVWRPDETSQRGLSLIGAVLGKINGQLAESSYQMVGFEFTGPLESRPTDSLAFVIARQEYSGLVLDNIRIARALAGGTGTQHRDQIMMEMSYGFNLTPQIRLQPNVHYIIHPDQMNNPSRLKDLPNAFLVGLRFDINFADAFRFND
jgi:porin